VSKGGRPFDLRPISSVSLIGHNAPSLATLMHRGVRFKKMTSKRSKATPSVAATTLTQAFKVNPQLIPVIPISTYTYTILSGCIDHNRNVIGNFALYQTLLFLINFRNIPLLLYLIHKTLHLVAANQRISKGPRCSIIGCRCPPINNQVSSTQEKSPYKHQDSTGMAESSTILSTSSDAPNSSRPDRCT
jgi:hypothetical protein